MPISRDTTHHLQKNATRVTLGTLLSKFSGLFRDISMARLYGDHYLVDAFILAFRYSNSVRRLLGEGSMLATFVPLYEELKKRDRATAGQFFRDLFLSLALALCSLTLIVELALGLILRFFPPATLTMRNSLLYGSWIFPGMIFICLSAISGTFLQCEHRFFLPAASPAIFNIIMCAGALGLAHQPIESAMGNLCLVTVLAYAFQCAFTFPAIQRLLCQRSVQSSWSKAQLFSTHILKMARPLGLGIVGVAGSQINSLVDSFFALHAERGAQTHLYYAMRLWQAPIALFGISLAGVALPTITRAIQDKDHLKARLCLQFSLRRALLLTGAATIALYTLGYAAVRMLFESEKFSPLASALTTRCLWGYALGLIPQTGVLLLSNVLYGLQLYRITTLATLAGVALNFICNALFVYVFETGSASIALATSMGTFLNLGILAHYLYRNYPDLYPGIFDATSRRILSLCATAGALTMLISIGLFGIHPLAPLGFGDLGSASNALRIATFFSQLIILCLCGFALMRKIAYRYLTRDSAR